MSRLREAKDQLLRLSSIWKVAKSESLIGLVSRLKSLFSKPHKNKLSSGKNSRHPTFSQPPFRHFTSSRHKALSLSTMKSVLILLSLISSFSIIHCQFNETLTNWIVAENVTALARIFDNIGNQGIFALDGDPGSVVASPSAANPDYYFQISPLRPIVAC